ncbi:tRNA pseudouridine(55) synthase TruB [Entomospira culicis]|uniref:tRNA pseudouridine synthase B n=1 Tax=Entomospira culicis TaxID=2719989 RepID=A0A968KW98_9SPIO|nr:tRNA pseudouridine(55) synthase TruB [Entomospira culicis]NIZ18732.1 tRNA pseudouridine(55) synthase TruB [Entomospira culicis]NIZ68947.1 tRNA pseudouridine(55) synthase TruB [Entomospira culicis]WDI37539.1 tRNA pseudouridine(55) synthase TruB [Entomospira culicis]WDI39167.1 tRNA pseudouridine(55) synthase TruB [Entomospira culicis]
MSAPHGLLLWHKHPNVTSFQALHPIKKALGKGVKVGHAGTLDKAAEGLQLVLVGAFTRLNPLFSHLDKEYIATISFGSETDTLDREGSVIKTGELPSYQRVQRALKELRFGTIMQAPPLYSAIHVDGKRAYQYARSDQAIEMKMRPVSLYNVEVIAIHTDDDQRVQSIVLDITCGSGFYVRSFARDFAYSCHSLATLTALERVGIGHRDRPWAFALDKAIADPSAIQHQLLSAREALGLLLPHQLAYVKPEYLSSVSQGKPFREEFLLDMGQSDRDKPLFLLNDTGALLAEVHHRDGRWSYQFVVHAP